jgi:hypothetical protein
MCVPSECLSSLRSFSSPFARFQFSVTVTFGFFFFPFTSSHDFFDIFSWWHQKFMKFRRWLFIWAAHEGGTLRFPWNWIKRLNQIGAKAASECVDWLWILTFSSWNFYSTPKNRIALEKLLSSLHHRLQRREDEKARERKVCEIFMAFR